MEKGEKDWLEPWKAFAEQYKGAGPVYESHWHPYLPRLRKRLDELMELMAYADIRKSVVPSAAAFRKDREGRRINVNEETFRLLEPYDSVSFAFAAHPKSIWMDPNWNEEMWENMEKLLRNPRCVAVGETGLDYSYEGFCPEHRRLQEEFFMRFAELADRQRLPMILHIRGGKVRADARFQPDVHEDALRILKAHPARQGAVLHCFDEDWDRMRRYLEGGVSCFGIGGNLLKGDEKLLEAVRKMPEESILLETDAPYLNTYSGIKGRNTPLLLFAVAEKIAEIRKTSLYDILERTFSNAEKIFETERENGKRRCIIEEKKTRRGEPYEG